MYSRMIQIKSMLKTTACGHSHVSRPLIIVLAVPFISFQPKVSFEFVVLRENIYVVSNDTCVQQKHACATRKYIVYLSILKNTGCGINHVYVLVIVKVMF